MYKLNVYYDGCNRGIRFNGVAIEPDIAYKQRYYTGSSYLASGQIFTPSKKSVYYNDLIDVYAVIYLITECNLLNLINNTDYVVNGVNGLKPLDYNIASGYARFMSKDLYTKNQKPTHLSDNCCISLTILRPDNIDEANEHIIYGVGIEVSCTDGYPQHSIIKKLIDLKPYRDLAYKKIENMYKQRGIVY